MTLNATWTESSLNLLTLNIPNKGDMLYTTPKQALPRVDYMYYPGLIAHRNLVVGERERSSSKYEFCKEEIILRQDGH